MGQSADAEIFWGYAWPNEETYRPWTIGSDNDPEDEWDERYAATQGLPPPTVKYTQANDALFSTYWEKKRALVEVCGVEVDSFGYYDYAHPCVRIKASRVFASDYGSKVFDPSKLVVGEDWQQKLDDFCRAMGIPIPAEGPRWYLAASYG